MTKKETAKVEQTPSISIENYANLNTIYADRIVNFAIGPMVSKLILAQENPNGSIDYSAQLVLPTPVLFDVVNGLHAALSKDDDMKKGIIEALEDFRESLDSD